MATSKLSKKYQIVIPRDVRKKLKLHVGEHVALYSLDEERAVLLKHPKSSVDALQGLGKEIWQSLGGGRKYIRQERASRAKNRT